MYSGIDIVDAHGHFPAELKDSTGLVDFARTMASPEKLKELEEKSASSRQQTSRAQEQWREAWGFSEPEPLGLNDADLADRWVEELDEHGIEKMVWVTGAGNSRLARVVNRHPDRFVGFAHHNPFAPDAADKLEEAVAAGLQGYKILAPLHDRPLDSWELFPLWEICQREKIPVLIHFGILGAGGGIAHTDNINPRILEDVAKEFPEVNFIIPHFGCGYPRELLFLGWVCENVYVDTSGSNQWMRWMPYEFDLKQAFSKFYRTFGPERIIFGTDSSWFPRGFSENYLQEQFKIARFMDMPPEHLEMIFGGNIMRLLGEDFGGEEGEIDGRG